MLEEEEEQGGVGAGGEFAAEAGFGGEPVEEVKGGAWVEIEGEEGGEVGWGYGGD